MKLSQLSKNINNGIKKNSNYIGIQNYLFIITSGKQGRGNYSKQQKRVYDLLSTNNTVNGIIYPDDIGNEELFEGVKNKLWSIHTKEILKQENSVLKSMDINVQFVNLILKNSMEKIGKNFIHIHHLKPLHEIDEEYKINPIQDLRPVCPNCHAMLHKKSPAYRIEEVQDFINKKDL